MYGIDKVIDEIRNRCWSKFDVDWIQWMINWMKHPAMPEEGVAVVEISAEPIEVEHKGEAEAPELPGWESENCSECWQNPCICEKWEEEKNDEAPFEDTSEERDEQDKASAEWMEAITDTKETMEDITPAEQDKMDEILKAIKTFFPNENTEDVLVRIVSKLIDR